MNKKIILSLLLLIITGVIWNFSDDSIIDDGLVIEENLSVVDQETQMEFILDNPTAAEFGEWISSQNTELQESVSQSSDVENITEKEVNSPDIEPSSEHIPQSINIDMSSEQYDTFLVLDAYMADPTYVSTLNINDLSQSHEFKSLPEMVQLLLLNKAISHLNDGNVSKEVFYGMNK